ncbi:hypothetical protein FJZ40_00850 [Candidatus Shapirobacteria bacterium]|nr:hypothetical protein [Candidatus Shapirobacteria bacterium]
MEEFIGKKVKVDFVQEIGWKRPTVITFGNKTLKIRTVRSRWEEHSYSRPWWLRKHRVCYEVETENGDTYQIYWDRGGSGKGKDWFCSSKNSPMKH